MDELNKILKSHIDKFTLSHFEIVEDGSSIDKINKLHEFAKLTQAEVEEKYFLECEKYACLRSLVNCLIIQEEKETEKDIQKLIDECLIKYQCKDDVTVFVCDTKGKFENLIKEKSKGQDVKYYCKGKSAVMKMLEHFKERMDFRCGVFQLNNVRNIKEYNERQIKNYKNSKTVLPVYFAIIDDLFDLIEYDKENVEIIIQSLTQLARTTGIHLVMFSSNEKVLTTSLKQNIPTIIKN